MRYRSCMLLAFLAICSAANAQVQPRPANDWEDVPAEQSTSGMTQNVLDLLNMAGTQTAAEFRPLSQAQRNRLYFRSMTNPLSFVRCAFSASLDQAADKPLEWEQGASGYGKRFSNIFGQYSIQRTVSFIFGSALHEDNRYFNSGKQGFWSRTGYALSSGVLARHDDGTRHFSVSQVGGVAAGSFLARVWLPRSQSSTSDAAVSFGLTMAGNIGGAVVKEFLPDLVRPFTKKHKPSSAGLARSGTSTSPNP